MHTQLPSHHSQGFRPGFRIEVITIVAIPLNGISNFSINNDPRTLCQNHEWQ